MFWLKFRLNKYNSDALLLERVSSVRVVKRIFETNKYEVGRAVA